MQAPVLHKVHDQHLWLTAQRSVFWEEQKTLIVSDLHFGKTGHFRKSGIPIPQNIYKEDLQRLVSLLDYFKPKQLIVVGDFFHSHANTELDWFQKWRCDLSHLKIVLVRGNHDILHNDWYQAAAIEVVENELLIAPFLFTHDKCDDRENTYTFCGHIHPGVYLQGLARQGVRLPCFYFAKNHCVLPAFSRFTGTALVYPAQGEKVFVIAEDRLMAL
jgi:DNA ligase-associated metallophosphoesterase